MIPLDPKEQAIFDYIKENIKKNGYSPSIRDIRTALNIKSTSTVHTYLERLERKGYIQKENGKSRTLRIEGLMPDEFDTKETNGMIPLIGRVTAGQPILAVENYEGYIQYPAGLRKMPENDLFALKVTGTSMIEAGIFSGDIVIVQKEHMAQNGDIVVALVEEEATVKRFYKENGRFRLQPENKNMEPIYTEEVYILGKVQAVIRYYRNN